MKRFAFKLYVDKHVSFLALFNFNVYHIFASHEINEQVRAEMQYREAFMSISEYRILGTEYI